MIVNESENYNEYLKLLAKHPKLFNRFLPQIKGGAEAGGGSSGAHATQDEGAGITQRSTVNFVGDGVVADDFGGKTRVTINGLTETAELTSGAVADTGNGVQNGIKRYRFFTFPTTNKLFLIVGIQWLNGSTISGNVMCGIDLVDANPPVIGDVVSLVNGVEVAHAGASSTQVNRQINRAVVRGGDVIGIWVNMDNGTGIIRFRLASSQNRQKTVAYNTNPPNIEETAWGLSTQEMALQVIYRGYN